MFSYRRLLAACSRCNRLQQSTLVSQAVDEASSKNLAKDVRLLLRHWMFSNSSFHFIVTLRIAGLGLVRLVSQQDFLLVFPNAVH
jgi:hypothetical protein